MCQKEKLEGNMLNKPCGGVCTYLWNSTQSALRPLGLSINIWEIWRGRHNIFNKILRNRYGQDEIWSETEEVMISDAYLCWNLMIVMRPRHVQHLIYVV